MGIKTSYKINKDMKTKTRRKNSIKLFVLFSLLFAINANAQTADFSGIWHIDTVRTKFNGAPTFVLPVNLKVSQTTAGITINRTNINGQQQEKNYIEQMTFDGKSSQTITVT